jgi:predicted DNA-binding protein YlxM (UPF0122 family)
MEKLSMNEKTVIRVLSKPQKKLLAAMIDSVSIVEAAEKIGMSRKTAYNLLYSLRKKYAKARAFVNYVDAQKRRGQLFKRVLTDRISVEEKELETEE